MKRVSVRLFFTVLWRGLCQVLGWFFGLFGYKRDGKFAKCVWGLFAVSTAIVMAILAVTLLCSLGETVYDKYYKEAHCYNPDCYYSQYLSANVYFHDKNDGNSYVYNTQTGKKTVKHIKWIAEPSENDSLICFSNGKKRGYFNKYSGQVVVEPKYDHAWIFSEGMACVDDNGRIKFIDSTGKVVIDKDMANYPDMDGFFFHGGYCVVKSADGQYGLMDKTGAMVLAQEYDMIDRSEEEELWRVEKGEEMAVFDKDMKLLVPFMQGHVYIGEGTIDVTMPDNTMRKYDLTGKLINDFYISDVRMLEYEKEDILYRRVLADEYDEDGELKQHGEMEAYHPKATARLRAYSTAGCEGLMTADGHIVTMPLYHDIDALAHDLYLCTTTNSDKVIVNGKGEIVK